MTDRRDILKTGLALGAAALGSNLLSGRSAAQTTVASSTLQAKVKTLLIASHPYPERSVLIKGLEEAARTVGNVTVRNLESLYGFDSRAIDGDAERRLTREHQRIVFLFPTHWFNITPMMKAWLNDTWGSVGPDLWKGKEMLVVSTAAGGNSTYGPSGRVGVRLADVFLPMKATALHCGMAYLPPLVFESATSSRLAEYQQALLQRLQG